MDIILKMYISARVNKPLQVETLWHVWIWPRPQFYCSISALKDKTTRSWLWSLHGKGCLHRHTPWWQIFQNYSAAWSKRTDAKRGGMENACNLVKNVHPSNSTQATLHPVACGGEKKQSLAWLIIHLRSRTRSLSCDFFQIENEAASCRCMQGRDASYLRHAHRGWDR